MHSTLQQLWEGNFSIQHLKIIVFIMQLSSSSSSVYIPIYYSKRREKLKCICRVCISMFQGAMDHSHRLIQYEQTPRPVISVLLCGWLASFHGSSYIREKGLEVSWVRRWKPSHTGKELNRLTMDSGERLELSLNIWTVICGRRFRFVLWDRQSQRGWIKVIENIWAQHVAGTSDHQDYPTREAFPSQKIREEAGEGPLISMNCNWQSSYYLWKHH